MPQSFRDGGRIYILRSLAARATRRSRAAARRARATRDRRAQEFGGVGEYDCVRPSGRASLLLHSGSFLRLRAGSRHRLLPCFLASTFARRLLLRYRYRDRHGALYGDGLLSVRDSRALSPALRLRFRHTAVLSRSKGRRGALRGGGGGRLSHELQGVHGGRKEMCVRVAKEDFLSV